MSAPRSSDNSANPTSPQETRVPLGDSPLIPFFVVHAQQLTGLQVGQPR